MRAASNALLVALVLIQNIGPLTADIIDHATVVDGDTLLISQVSIKLAGIDAPELGQKCKTTGDIEWSCGSEAKRTLSREIDGKPVSCRNLTFVSDGHVVAYCRSSTGHDLAAAMVSSGYALAESRDPRYATDEAAARRTKRGIWSGSFQTPWEWRAQQLGLQDD